MTTVLLIGISGLFFLFFMWFTLVSGFEHEPRATKIGILFTIVIPSIICSSIVLPEIFQWLILFIIALGILVLAISFIFPGTKHVHAPTPGSILIDERNTMFSRNEIRHSKERSDQYYNDHPENLVKDQIWHKKPGLMNNRATMYNTLAFAAADASFFAIEELRSSVEPKVAETKINIDTKELSAFLQNWSIKLGAINFGICELQPYHLYSHRGRGTAYGEPVNNSHKYGIAITVEMDKDFLAAGPASPTLMESAQQYLNSGAIAIQIAKFITNLGYKARAHIDGNYEVICPLVAQDAGIGNIGRMGLLMTPELGPRVRIAVVTTEIPLIPSLKKPDLSIQDFCNICKKCATVCPSQAVPTNEKQQIGESIRWQINQEKCFGYWCTSGTDCGRCMSVCPYSHPNNLLHNMVRSGIKYSWLFRRIALKLDDLFYGTKPKPAPITAWIPSKN